MAQPSDLIVVTGAAGQQCSRLVPLLYPDYRLRLVVQSSSSAERLRSQYPKAEVVQADLVVPAECAKVVAGATTVYGIGPPLHMHEKEMALFLIDAAVDEAAKPDSSFKHFVMSSVLNTQLRKMSNHDDKRSVEEYLIESGLDYTILQPGDFYEQQFYVQEWMAQPAPRFLCMLNPESVSSVVFLDDLAQAAATVIAEQERHYAALYPLVSRGPVKYQTLVEETARAMGKPLGLQRMTLLEAFDQAMVYTQGGVDQTHVRARDKVERMILFYHRRGIKGNPTVLEWLLGRKPTTVDEYVQRELAAMKR